MITIKEYNDEIIRVEYIIDKEKDTSQYVCDVHKVLKGKYLETYYLPSKEQELLFIGCGSESLGYMEVREIFAKTSSVLKEYNIKKAWLDLSFFMEKYGAQVLPHIVAGLYLGSYEFKTTKKSWLEMDCVEYQFGGLTETPEIVAAIEEAKTVIQGKLFAKDMVNMPGNMLRPMDLARNTLDFVSELPIDTELFVYGQLKSMGMNALTGVGGSSEYPPCLLILRYKGNPEEETITGLVGKGVTCDTGGYCLKSAGSMVGMKGDMAGAAAVIAAVYSLAKNKVPVNVTACIPLCENRISQNALLPGDVITSYSGKTIEIINTDAEGRLILADAVSYMVRKEQITRVLDIATLTGAVRSALGFTIGGALSDDDEFYSTLEAGLEKANEKFLRFPYGKEHKKMIESKIADVKNLGEAYCGTITAGLFVQCFAENTPWIHLDIAGTAWTDSPNYSYEQKGATGAGVEAIYYMF